MVANECGMTGPKGIRRLRRSKELENVKLYSSQKIFNVEWHSKDVETIVNLIQNMHRNVYLFEQRMVMATKEDT